jgi:hypothetical protein
MASKPHPDVALGVLVNPHDCQLRRAHNTLDEIDSGTVSLSTPKKRPGLSDHMIRRQQRLALHRPEPYRGLMVLVVQDQAADPKGRVDEPHRP